MGYITTEDVQDFLRDGVDNSDGMGAAYTPKQLLSALVRAAREYNSIMPICIKTTPDTMSDETNMFLDAAVEQLFISERNELARLDIEYTAGNVTVPIDRTRLQHLDKLIKFHGDRFREAARAYKVSTNVRRAFRHFR